MPEFCLLRRVARTEVGQEPAEVVQTCDDNVPVLAQLRERRATVYYSDTEQGITDQLVRFWLPGGDDDLRGLPTHTHAAIPIEDPA